MERDDLGKMVSLLKSGGVILYPTDTIWGLGCDAMNLQAIERISAIKHRPADKPVVLLVSSIEMLKHYVTQLHPKIETLLAYHERPVTILYDNVVELPDIHKAADGSIAIRVVKDPFCIELIEAFGGPIVSAAANVCGEPFPENFGQISSEILASVDYVVKHRQTDRTAGEPSMLIRFSPKGELIFLRR
jgi:L-threonylcarbamoyladenylate synthase